MAWQRVCSSQELAEGGAAELAVGNDVIAVYRHESNLYAMEGVCMHQGGPLARGKICNGIVTCPWHGWQYELATGNHVATRKHMLKTYEIREIDGAIEVDVPA